MAEEMGIKFDAAAILRIDIVCRNARVCCSIVGNGHTHQYCNCRTTHVSFMQSDGSFKYYCFEYCSYGTICHYMPLLPVEDPLP